MGILRLEILGVVIEEAYRGKWVACREVAVVRFSSFVM